MDELPNEIIDAILVACETLKVPLFHLRLVCKKWNALIERYHNRKLTDLDLLSAMDTIYEKSLSSSPRMVYLRRLGRDCPTSDLVFVDYLEKYDSLREVPTVYVVDILKKYIKDGNQYAANEVVKYLERSQSKSEIAKMLGHLNIKQQKWACSRGLQKAFRLRLN